MKAITLIAISILLFFVSSCYKGVSHADDELNPIGSLTTKVLNKGKKDKLIKRQVSFPTTNSWLKTVSEFSYDEQGRVSQVRTGSIDSSVLNPQFQVRMSFTLNYNGSSILPLSTARTLIVFPNLVSTTHHKYNRFGDKIMDSISVKNTNGELGYQKAIYEYNKKDIYATASNLGFPLNQNPLDTLTFKNSNIEKQVTIRMTPNGERRNEYIYEYDNNPNPFKQLNVFNSLYFTSPGSNNGFLASPFPYIGINKNNITAYKVGDVTFNHVYVYDAEGYPIKQSTIFPGSSTPGAITYYQY